jgi:phosphate/phosphite/phosphonate ABC transporter binding protein
MFGPLAQGGAPTVHFGRLLGPVGFSRTVAIKRIKAQLADDPDFVDMFVKETKLAARVKHTHVVSTSDVVPLGDELLLVTDYVGGESVARLFRTLLARGEAFPPRVAAAIVLDVLHGLHAIHEAKDESGEPLDMVHRDVSPSNVLLGADGVARLVDFGVAKALAAGTTQPGMLKRKIPYMPPERMKGEDATRATDVWSAGVVLWELLTGKRRFTGADDAETISRILEAPPELPSAKVAREADAEVVRAYDEVVRRATAADPAERFPTALEMARALEACGPVAGRSELVDFVQTNAKEALEQRARALTEVEKQMIAVSGPPSAESVRSVGGGVRPKVVFGLVVPEAQTAVLAPQVDDLLEWLSDEVGVDMIRRSARSYESLARAVREGKVDLAWLPPIVYVRIVEGVTPLGAILRGAKATYEAALVVRADAKARSVDALRGTRAGWVDPWSAAGFVLPRLELAAMGVDPRALFRTEKFLGSHHGAIEALMEGACDVAGTYARADDKGEVTTGAWSEVRGADVRVLTTFGAIPPDVLAVRRNLLPATYERVLVALRTATKSEDARALLKAVFGGEELTEELSKGYDTLRTALDSAIARGLFD